MYVSCNIILYHSTFQRKFYAYIFDPQNSAFQKHPHFQHYKKFGFLCVLSAGAQLFAPFCCVLFILTFKRLAVYFCVLCPHISRRSEAVPIRPGFCRKRRKTNVFAIFWPGHMRFCGHFLPTMLPTTEKCTQNKQNNPIETGGVTLPPPPNSR